MMADASNYAMLQVIYPASFQASQNVIKQPDKRHVLQPLFPAIAEKSQFNVAALEAPPTSAPSSVAALETPPTSVAAMETPPTSAPSVAVLKTPPTSAPEQEGVQTTSQGNVDAAPSLMETAPVMEAR